MHLTVMSVRIWIQAVEVCIVLSHALSDLEAKCVGPPMAGGQTA